MQDFDYEGSPKYKFSVIAGTYMINITCTAFTLHKFGFEVSPNTYFPPAFALHEVLP